jgi:ABC-type transport system involved in cytochrome c biogenesis ATPase subunit/GNAT superfamily N-acetyltransferase
MQRFEVTCVSPKDQYRRVCVSDHSGKSIQLQLHRYAVIGKGDTILIDPKRPSTMSVMSIEDPAETIKLMPPFQLASEFTLGMRKYPVRITDIVSSEDLEQYKFLEQFHYKTAVSLADDDAGKPENGDSGGRKAILLCYLRTGARWQAVGYIELQMPLLMVKPRHVLFDHPFKHPSRPIEWQHWDLDAMKKFVNTIVRIARVVTSPEFRGLGLSRTLIGAAITFARERWHIAGRRPLFMEISAEMLKYLDFVSSSGLRFVGNTEGNLQRISKDIVSMQRGQKITSGIMSLQKKYLTRLQASADKIGKNFEESVALIKAATEHESVLNSLPVEDWYLVKSVLRFPIPYFICGLDEASSAYISQNSENIAAAPATISFACPTTTVRINGLTAFSRFSVPHTPSIRTIMDCFGLQGETLSSQVFAPIDIQASSGNIIFIAGASGSGKSVLLRAMDPRFSIEGLRIVFEGKRSEYSAGWIDDLPQGVPIIQHFSERWGMERAIAALNQAGLSEAFVYLKPYELLSRGQRYRAKLADLALRSDQVWLIDEFCADLDPLTARIVARNLRRHVVKYRRIAFVAAANFEHFLDALTPTRVIFLRQGFKPQILNYREFTDEFRREDDGEVRHSV